MFGGCFIAKVPMFNILVMLVIAFLNRSNYVALKIVDLFLQAFFSNGLDFLGSLLIKEITDTSTDLYENNYTVNLKKDNNSMALKGLVVRFFLSAQKESQVSTYKINIYCHNFCFNMKMHSQ